MASGLRRFFGPSRREEGSGGAKGRPVVIVSGGEGAQPTTSGVGRGGAAAAVGTNNNNNNNNTATQQPPTTSAVGGDGGSSSSRSSRRGGGGGGGTQQAAATAGTSPNPSIASGPHPLLARPATSPPPSPPCDKNVWRSRAHQILLPPFALLCVGAALVTLLWYWTHLTQIRDAENSLQAAHDGAMTALAQSVSAFSSIISVYSHALDTIEFFPFQTAETMFGPMLQRANFTGGTCAVISRVRSEERRRTIETLLSAYASRPIAFRGPGTNASIPYIRPEYWVISQGDAGLSGTAYGFDVMNVSILMDQITSSVEKNIPVASQSATTGSPDTRLFLITDAVYSCDNAVFRDLDSRYNASQVKPRGSTNLCSARTSPVDNRRVAVSGAVTCTTQVKSFFQSPVFFDERTCYRVVDEAENVTLWKSTTENCRNVTYPGEEADNEGLGVNVTRRSSDDSGSSDFIIDPISSVFVDHGRRWRMTHYALPTPFRQEDVAMLAGYSTLFVLIAIGVTILLYFRERTRGQDLKIEHSKRESLRVFLDTTSHDMRSPLQASMNLVHLIIAEQRNRLTPGGLEDLRTLQHTLLLLEDIVSNVLDFQKIESGTVQFGAERNIDILSELKSLLQIVGHGAAVKSHCRFNFHVSPKNNVRTTCDRARICRAVMNVVSNAIKFTQQGFVEVQVAVLNSNSETMQLHVVVRDSGPGIPDNIIPRLFLPYEGVGINEGGGSGLGMFITKAVVDHYNGNIFVNSKVGEGSCFTLQFQLPVTQPIPGAESASDTILSTSEEGEFESSGGTDDLQEEAIAAASHNRGGGGGGIEEGRGKFGSGTGTTATTTTSSTSTTNPPPPPPPTARRRGDDESGRNRGGGGGGDRGSGAHSSTSNNSSSGSKIAPLGQHHQRQGGGDGARFGTTEGGGMRTVESTPPTTTIASAAAMDEKRGTTEFHFPASSAAHISRGGSVISADSTSTPLIFRRDEAGGLVSSTTSEMRHPWEELFEPIDIPGMYGDIETGILPTILSEQGYSTATTSNNGAGQSYYNNNNNNNNNLLHPAEGIPIASSDLPALGSPPPPPVPVHYGPSSTLYLPQQLQQQQQQQSFFTPDTPLRLQQQQQQQQLASSYVSSNPAPAPPPRFYSMDFGSTPSSNQQYFASAAPTPQQQQQQQQPMMMIPAMYETPDMKKKKYAYEKERRQQSPPPSPPATGGGATTISTGTDSTTAFSDFPAPLRQQRQQQLQQRYLEMEMANLSRSQAMPPGISPSSGRHHVSPIEIPPPTTSSYQQQQQQQADSRNASSHSRMSSATTSSSSVVAPLPTTTTTTTNNASGGGGGASKRHSIKKVSVLFAEDNVINMRTGTRILKSFGADVIPAHDGREAWEAAKEQYKTIDICLLDVNMPIMCGDEVCKKIRQMEKENGITHPKPVYALTGHAEHQIMTDLFAAGFTDVLTKPATPATLNKLIHRKV